jgi:hypothetical protein
MPAFAWGTWRDSESIIAKACSAAAMVLPFRRVHYKNTPLGGSGDINVVHPNASAANDLKTTGSGNHRRSHSSAGADHQSVVLTNNPHQLVFAQTDPLIDLRHLIEDVQAGLINRIGNQNFRHERAQNCLLKL